VFCVSAYSILSYRYGIGKNGKSDYSRLLVCFSAYNFFSFQLQCTKSGYVHASSSRIMLSPTRSSLFL
jgi:hypothetical protein